MGTGLCDMSLLCRDTRASFAVCSWFTLNREARQVRLARTHISSEIGKFATRALLARAVGRIKSCLQERRRVQEILFFCLRIRQSLVYLVSLQSSLVRQKEREVPSSLETAAVPWDAASQRSPTK